MEPAGNETENLRGRMIEPLRIVDDANERPVFRNLGEQRQRGQPDEESVRCSPRAQSEHRGEASRCGSGKRSTRSIIGAQS